METKRDTEPACQHGEPWPEWKGPTNGSFNAYLTHAEYVRARACVNACAGIPTKELHPGSGDLPEVANKLLEQRDALRDELAAAVEQRDRLLEAAKATMEAHDSLFVQCCSNPITNAWGKEVDVSLFNEAARMAGNAIASIKGAVK